MASLYPNMNFTSCARFVVAVFMVIILICDRVQAETYPNKSVTLIVPQAAGGGTIGCPVVSAKRSSTPAVRGA